MTRVVAMIFAIILVVLVVPSPSHSQLVSPRPGVELPQAYFDRVAQDKTAFQFQRAWIQKAERAREARREFMARDWRPGMSLTTLPEAQRQSIMVAGTVNVPVFLGKFSNTVTEPYPHGDLQTKLFAPPPALSMTSLYDEMSYGNVNLTGTVYDWFQVSETDLYYEALCNGLCPTAKTGQFIQEILVGMDPSVDFDLYDNDGPDGVPNSGDDDGYVDFVAFVHPERGGECGTSNLWSHRWVVGGWPEFGEQPWVTDDASANGGFIKVWDYTIQPALGSGDNGCGDFIIEIGVFCHEFGHAFGLPDLYDTNGGSSGIGHWGLMGSGNWNTPPNPSHMSAWSKIQLGWVMPTDVDAFSQAYTIDAVENTAEIFKLDVMEQKFCRKYMLSSYKMHCGLTDAEAGARGWSGGAGYGNSWNESVCREFSYDASTPVTLEYDYSYHTEAGYDFASMLIEVGGVTSTVVEYNGFNVGHETADLTPYLSGSGVSSYKLIARLESDFGYSDEDGEFNSGTAGPFAFDNLSVTGGGESYYTDFEIDDGGWYYDFEANPTKEYYLVENRNSSGSLFDQSLHANGLAIWHVEDYVMMDGGLGNTGGTGNGATRGVMLVEADAMNEVLGGVNRGDAGDVFPGGTGNTMFNDATTPRSASHNGIRTNVIVNGISAPGAQMTANLRDGLIPPYALSVAPDFGYNDRQVFITDVIGVGFVHGSSFLLRDAAQADYAASIIDYFGRGRLGGVIDLNGLATGTYDFVVVNPDGQESIIEDAFLVKDIVPVFIQTFDARTTREGIELAWEIWADENIRGFKISRRQTGDSKEVLIHGASYIEPDQRTFVDDTVVPATGYEYFLTVVLEDRTEVRSPMAAAMSTSYVLSLNQNFPNPFNPTTRISFLFPIEAMCHSWYMTRAGSRSQHS